MRVELKEKGDAKRGEGEKETEGGGKRGDLLERSHVLSTNNMILRNDLSKARSGDYEPML